MNTLEVKGKLEQHFRNVELVHENVFRAERQYGGLPYAVYYFDISDSLDERAINLGNFQDEVIGERYFSEKESLKWNNYLLFLTSSDRTADPKIESAKRLIEADRRYARKYVVAEKDLDEFVQGIASNSEVQPPTDVLSVWSRKLSEAGLERILHDTSLSEAVRLVEYEPEHTNPVRRPLPREVAKGATEFIDELEIVNFRKYPSKKKFKFGRVNLLIGVNGVGKTSLLEAIEYFYCGRNKRNAEVSNPSARIEVRFLGCEKTEAATGNRESQLFRDRHLAWYGQLELRTNNLFQSFNRFNFLNTDAAVILSESKDEDVLSDDLSKLLVGPDASKTWQRIDRVSEAIESRYKNLTPVFENLQQEVVQIRKAIDTPLETALESDHLYQRCVQGLKNLGLKRDTPDKDELPKFAIDLLASAAGVLSRNGSRARLSQFKTTFEIREWCSRFQADVEWVQSAIKILQERELDTAARTAENKSAESTLEQLVKLQKYFDSGFAMALEELEQVKVELGASRKMVAGINVAQILEVLSNVSSGASVQTYFNGLITEEKRVGGEVSRLEREYKTFTSTQTKLRAIKSEIRDLARAMVDAGHESDECPVCRTILRDGELLERISNAAGSVGEQSTEAILLQLRKLQEEHARIKTSRDAMSELVEFCLQSDFDQDVARVHEVIQGLMDTRDRCAALQAKLDSLQKFIDELRKDDLSDEEYRVTAIQLTALSYPTFSSGDEISTEIVNLRRLISSQAELITDLTDEVTQLGQKILRIYKRFGLSAIPEDPRKAVLVSSEFLAAAHTFLKKWDSLSESLPLDDGRSIEEIENDVAAVYADTQQLISALANEERTRSGRKRDTERLAKLSGEVEELQPRLKRLFDAITVLRDIRENHSLVAAMESTLAENRANIERIFAKIHAPREFSGLGASLSSLVRLGEAKETKLSQVSTGQRAAYALSIFLALNAQLKTAPPVMLIDDPIAHVDDLNSLSFLDYLREVAIDGKRQLFFATADQKLASLFERKFAFLGSDFSKHDLSREAS